MKKDKKIERYEFRTTKEFKKLMQLIANKKQISVPELIHQLVLKEYKEV